MDRNGLSMKIVNLHKYDPSKNRKRLIASEFERHEGWIESIKNEKKNIIDSIKTSIDYGYTRNLDRAKQNLNT